MRILSILQPLQCLSLAEKGQRTQTEPIRLLKATPIWTASLTTQTPMKRSPMMHRPSRMQMPGAMLSEALLKESNGAFGFSF